MILVFLYKVVLVLANLNTLKDNVRFSSLNTYIVDVYVLSLSTGKYCI